MLSWSRYCRCSCWLKYVLYTINFIVCTCCLGATAVGVCAWYDNKHAGMLGHLPAIPGLLLASIGSIGSLIGFIGCLGAARENLCLLKTFCLVASLLFLCEIIGGTLMFTLMYQVRNVFQSYLLQAVINYQQNEQQQDLLDYIQPKLECCGASGYHDWDNNVYFTCSAPVMSKLHCSVPVSCCSIRHSFACGLRSRPHGDLAIESTVYAQGCTEPLLQAFKITLFHISILAFAIGICEVIGVVLANALMRDILRSSVTPPTDIDLVLPDTVHRRLTTENNVNLNSHLTDSSDHILCNN